MTDEHLTSTTESLGIPVDPAWLPTIRANLDITRRMAALVLAHPLPDEAEPAPLFQA